MENSSNEQGSKSKVASPFKWRLQYGRRPPRKADAVRAQEQEMIEKFLASQSGTIAPPSTSSKVKTKSADSQAKDDQRLMAKFTKRHLQNLT